MKVEECIVSVERRTFGGCMDLAFVFSREFAAPITRLWLICAVPSCALVWLTVSRTTDMLIPSLMIFMFFSAIFNALLVACMGPQVFGVPISVRASVKAWRHRFWSWLLLSFVTRFFQFISGFCLIVPSVFVTAYAGHMPEVLFLEQSKLNGVTARLSWLSGGGGYGRSLGRVLGLLFYWSFLSFGLFVLIDVAATMVFNRPIFFAILFEASRDGRDVFLQLTHDDPAFLTTIQLALWLPYPVIRLAWFFCYLDQRIRNECWDLQLQYRAEAARLEELA
ncbi:MAG: hypothetical protein U0936_21265 [Planctomycetaceae bacterium]